MSALPATPAVAEVSPSGSPAASASPRRRRSSRAQATAPPPIVRTLTRIVDVVPLPLRIAIAALLALALALAVRSRLAARRASRLSGQREQLLQDVGILQAALLPALPGRIGPVMTSAAYMPADGPGAGGDFYDVFALESGQVAAILGDVSGHGRQALPHTALVRFTLRAYLEAGLAPRDAIRTAGRVLERQLGESFVTVAVATYAPRERTLVYSCAGHPPPLVLGDSRALTPVSACSAPPIAAGLQTGTRQTVVSIPGGARVCLHTDGVTDARSGAERFGSERLQSALADLGPQASADELLARVAARTDARPDDMAACLLSIEGGAEPPRIVSEQLHLAGGEQTVGGRPERFLAACGLTPEQVHDAIVTAREEAIRAGGALLEVRKDGTEARVDVRADNVPELRAAAERRRMSVGAAR